MQGHRFQSQRYAILLEHGIASHSHFRHFSPILPLLSPSGAVAAQSFDDFHKNSAEIIRFAVFGKQGADKQAKDKLLFTANSLAITNVDIQAVEPVEQRTRDALQKSVQVC